MAEVAGITGRSVLVTGGSRGIGAAIVSRLAKLGARVMLNYHSQEETAAKLCRTLTAQGCTVEIAQADVADPKAVAAMLAQMAERFGELDAVVNNAGIAQDAMTMTMSLEQWQQVLQTNLTGTFLVTKEALKRMVRRRSGAILNIASAAAFSGLIGSANYTAAKAGILGFTRSVAKEVAKSGIRINCLAPGFVATEMLAGMSPEKRTRIQAGIPAGRLGTTEEIAAAAAFLLSDAAGYITGQTWVVDGGLSLGFTAQL